MKNYSTRPKGPCRRRSKAKGAESYQSTLFISCNDEKAPVSPACFDEVAAFLSNKNEKVSSVLSIIMSADRTVADIVIIQDVDRPYIDPAATVQSLCNIAARHNCAVRGNLYILAESCNLASMEICCVADGKAIVLDATSGPEKAIFRKRKIAHLRRENECLKKGHVDATALTAVTPAISKLHVDEKSVILHVKADAADVVHCIETRIDEHAKELIYYGYHDSPAYAAIEDGKFDDYWEWHMRDDMESELESVDPANKWAFDKHANEVFRSERQVHYVPLGNPVIPVSSIAMSEWVFPLVLKEEIKN